MVPEAQQQQQKKYRAARPVWKIPCDSAYTYLWKQPDWPPDGDRSAYPCIKQPPVVPYWMNYLTGVRARGVSLTHRPIHTANSIRVGPQWHSVIFLCIWNSFFFFFPAYPTAGNPTGTDLLMSTRHKNRDGERNFLEFWQLNGHLASKHRGVQPIECPQIPCHSSRLLIISSR